MDLNASQKKAVTCDLRPTIVIAGPGSGKTHVIVNRMNYMIETLKCSPHHMLVVTFSKLAANEMRERFIKHSRYTGVTFGTLHSIFYRILKRAQPSKYALENLLSENEKKHILQNLFVRLEVDEYEDFIDEFLKHLALMKNQLINPKYYYPDGISKEVFIKLLRDYEYYKETHQKFDFDDMLVDCYHLLCHDGFLLKAIQNQYRYILVDEFQDINFVQFEVIRMIAGEEARLFVVGDDDQSIYRFRGAKPEFLLNFKTYFPNVQQFFLEVNYRSTKNILNYSIALITSNQTRYSKQLTTPNQAGDPPRIIHCQDTKEEADLILKEIIHLKNRGVSLSHMAIIYRTNVEVRPIVELLLISLVPFSLRDGMVSLYDQWITKDILNYLSLAQDPNRLDLAVLLINKPKRYISKVIIEQTSRLEGCFLFNLLALEALSEWQKNYIQQLLFDLQILKDKPLKEAIAYIRQNIGYDSYLTDYAAYRKLPAATLLEVLDELEESATNFKTPEEWEIFLKDMAEAVKKQSAERTASHEAVTLTTMHGAKGLEFKYVFILNLVEGSMPHQKSHSDSDLEEERRLLYVAMTRAKDYLYLYIPALKYGKPVGPSFFVEELLSKYLKHYLQKNKMIVHNKFGTGKVLNILDKNILEVQFSSHIRKIDGNYCINNGIIRWEE